MVIGVDLDEVLVPTLSYHCNFLNRKYNLSLKEEDFHAYRFWEIYHVSREQATKDWFEFCDTNIFMSMEPFPEALDGVRELKKLRELYVVTSRQNSLRGVTQNFVDKNFPGIFSKIVSNRGIKLSFGIDPNKI